MFKFDINYVKEHAEYKSLFKYDLLDEDWQVIKALDDPYYYKEDVALAYCFNKANKSNISFKNKQQFFDVLLSYLELLNLEPIERFNEKDVFREMTEIVERSISLEYEKQIINCLIDTLLENDFYLAVSYNSDPDCIGDEEIYTKDKNVILSHLYATDEEIIMVSKDGEICIGTIFLVYGNEGWTVIGNYSIVLEEYMSSVDILADKLSDEYFKL